jgi:uncharacterized protein (DUF58 family)
VEVDAELLSLAARLRLTAPRFSRGQRQGERRGRATGQGQEFADYRPYNPGDDLRRVDWNAYRRLESLLVRLSHEDRDQRVLLALDATGSMALAGKADHAATITAGLALSGLLARDHVRLGIINHTPTTLTGEDPRALPAMITALQAATPGGQADVRALVLAWAAGRRFDRAILLSDLLLPPDEAEGALAALATVSDRPTLLHVLSKEDVEPDLSGSLELEDAETGERLLVEGGRGIAEAYREAYARWDKGLSTLCSRLRIQRIPAPTQLPPAALLSDGLRRAGLVRSQRGESR